MFLLRCFRFIRFVGAAQGEYSSPGHQKNGALAHKLGNPVTFDNKFFGGCHIFGQKMDKYLNLRHLEKIPTADARVDCG